MRHPINLSGAPADRLSRALQFLFEARSEGGWWRDFKTLAGTSDEWVTAYVGYALAFCTDLDAREASNAAWSLLKRRHPWRAGWGHNRAVPADADTTAWSLLLSRRLGIKGGRRQRRAEAFLKRHLRVDGGVSTFATAGPLHRFTRLSRPSFRGWCQGHTCVTAAAALLPELARPATRYLQTFQCADGSWDGYWWQDRSYTTSLAAQAVHGSDIPERAAIVKRAMSWARSELTTHLPTVTAFQLAGCLSVLGLDESDPCNHRVIRNGLDRLTELQCDDGAWPSSASLRIPPPDLIDPNEFEAWEYGGRGGGAIVSDQCRVFTTATVVRALVAMNVRRGDQDG